MHGQQNIKFKSHALHLWLLYGDVLFPFFFFSQKHKELLTPFILVANKQVWVYLVSLCLNYDSYETVIFPLCQDSFTILLYIRSTKFSVRLELNINI